MPQIKAKQSKKTQDKKKLIASKLMKISLKIDNYIYKQTPITEEDAEILLKQVASYTEKCYNDARCLQVIEKLIRCLKTIIQEQRELKKKTHNDIQDNSNVTNVTIHSKNNGQNKEIDVDNILNNIGAKIKRHDHRHNKNLETSINREKVTAIDLNDIACTNFDNDKEENIGFNKINCPKKTNSYLIEIDQTNFDICSQSILDDDIIQIIDINTILNKTNGDKTNNYHYLNDATNKETVTPMNTSNDCDKTKFNTGKDNKINLNDYQENAFRLNEPSIDTEIYSQSILDNFVDDHYNKREFMNITTDKYSQDKNVKTGESGLLKETKNGTSTNSEMKRFDLIKFNDQTNLKQVDERKDVVAKTRKPRNIKNSIIQETTQNKNKIYKIEQKTNKQNIGKSTHKKDERETNVVAERNTYKNEWKVPNKYKSNKELKENNGHNTINTKTDKNSKTYNAKQNMNKKTPNFNKIKKKNKYCTIYNKSVEVDLSWIENIRYVREVNQEEIYPALFEDTFWENCTLPNDWNDEEFLC